MLSPKAAAAVAPTHKPTLTLCTHASANPDRLRVGGARPGLRASVRNWRCTAVLSILRAMSVCAHIFAALLAATSLAALSACDDASLEVDPIEPQVAYVGELTRVPITVRNPTGAALELSYSGPVLENLDRWATLQQRPEGAEFQWHPTEAHVGVHRIDILAAAGGARTSRGFDIEIIRARDAAPVFVDPPRGAALDLARDACFSLPVEVRDNDSDEVALRVAHGAPDGMTLELVGREGTLRWCPRPDQRAASALWTVTLEADDGEHAPVLRELRLVLLDDPKPSCEGRAPEIEWLAPSDGDAIVSEVGYRVSMRVQDDAPLRDAPLLFYTAGRLDQRDRIDLAGLDMVAFRAVGERWEAVVPTFRLAPDEVRTVSVLAWVNDDNDPAGSRCDLRAPLRARSFVAIGAVEAGILPDCAPCTQSGDCRSGACLATPEGGRCVPACGPELACSIGECGAFNSPEGVVRQACGPAEWVCDAIPACVDDPGESDNAREDAPPLDRERSGVACPYDDDFAVFRSRSEGRARVTLESDAPLDLRLLDAEGSIRAVADGEGAASACVAADEDIYAHVGHFRTVARDAANYTLRVDLSPEACACAPDAAEPDRDAPPTWDDAPSGVLCVGDVDARALVARPDERLRVSVRAEPDVDLELLRPDGAVVARAQGATGDETITLDAIDGPLVARLFSTEALDAAWTLDVVRTPLPLCDSDAECDAALCIDGRCAQRPCARNADCPDHAICPRVALGEPRTCRATCEGTCPGDATCKRFPEGRSCVPPGAGETGAPCASASDCAGERVCIDAPDGYCAAADCALGCPSGDVCGVLDGEPLCLASCWLGDAACDGSRGHVCAEVFDRAAELALACVPEAR